MNHTHTNCSSQMVMEGYETWEIILFALIGLIGTLNNGFTILVIMSSKAMMKKVTNKMIVNQTIIDLVASLFFLANAATAQFSVLTPGVKGELYCHLWGTNYFMWAVLNALSFNLMALTIERFYGVIKPVKYRKFTPLIAKIVMVSVWVGGLIITAPHIFAAAHCTNLKDGSTKCIPYPEKPGNWLILNGLVNYCAVFLAPVLSMFVCYSQMICFFRKKSPVDKEDNSDADKQRLLKMRRLQLNIFKTFIIVSVAFIVCWAPSQTLILLFNFGALNFTLDSPIMKWSYYLTYANCCMNPFIYTFQYYDFQVALRKLCDKYFNKNKEIDSNFRAESSHTTN